MVSRASRPRACTAACRRPMSTVLRYRVPLALFRTSASVLGAAYSGYDALLYINLSGNSFSNPEFGIAGALQQLLSGGWATSPTFGGSGPTAIGSIAGGTVYATLIPTATTLLPSIQLGSFSASGVALSSDGQALYVVPEPSTVAMALMGAFGLLLALRRRKSA